VEIVGRRTALFAGPAFDRLAGTLADLASIDVEPGHARGGREGYEGVICAHFALADRETLLGQHDDGSPLGRLVRQRGQLGGVGDLLFAVPTDREEVG